MEVGVRTDRALPYHAGQYAQVRFNGFPSRPFSITHAVSGDSNSRSVWFHIRRMKDGLVTTALGKKIRRGHRVTLTGPYGSAHFRPNLAGRLILVSTNTGFAPIWSIAVSALREDPRRPIMVIVGGGTIDALYMGPALVRLAQFPNVRVVPVCSAPQRYINVLPGRPTDHMPHLVPDDVVYACGAPGMVDAIKSVAAQAGAACHADPFVPMAGGSESGGGVLTRAKVWLQPAVRAVGL